MRSAETSTRDTSAENNYFKFNLNNTAKEDFISLKVVCPIDERILEMDSDFSDSMHSSQSSMNIISDEDTNSRHVMVAETQL